MTKDEIRAIALEVAKELLDEPLNIGQAEHYTDFATRFLAAIEPAPQAAFDQEIKDSDELLRLLNLPPDRYRTECGSLNIPKVKAAVREPWDYPTIDPVNPPVQSSVGAPPLPDEVARMVATLSEMCWDECDSAAKMIERLARQVPEGCVVVPRNPTLEMRRAGGIEMTTDADAVYRAMIDAWEVKP